MAGRRLVASSVWNELRPLLGEAGGQDAALLYLYALTGPHSNLVGLFSLPAGYVAEDLGWTAERAAAARELLELHGLVAFDATARVLWVPSLLRSQPLQNSNQVLSAVRAVAGLPYTALMGQLYDELLPQLSARPFLQLLLELLAERLGKRFQQLTGDGSLPAPAPTPAPAPAPEPLPELSREPLKAELAANRHRLASMTADLAKRKAMP